VAASQSVSVRVTHAALFRSAAALSQAGQQQTKAPIVLPAARAAIFDSMGSPLALGEQATTVYVDPSAVTRARQEAKVAARVLGRSEEHTSELPSHLNLVCCL